MFWGNSVSHFLAISVPVTDDFRPLKKMLRIANFKLNFRNLQFSHVFGFSGFFLIESDMVLNEFHINAMFEKIKYFGNH